MRLFAFLLMLFALGAEAAAPVVSCTPTRTCDGAGNVCPAPTAVLMDCTASTADALADGRTAFHSINFSHTVSTSNGSVAGTWTYGAKAGQKKNFMKGPLAAYVFHTAGTYTWSICGIDATGAADCDTPKTFVISSADSVYSGTNTICVYNNDLGSGCPTGADTYQSADLDAALTAKWGANKRILLKGGDTFTASATTSVSSSNGRALSSYGGTRAIVKTSSTDEVLSITGTSNRATIYGIEFNGESQSGSRVLSFGNTAWTNFLAYDNAFTNWNAAIGGANWNSTGGQGFYFIGNTLINVAGSQNTDGLLPSRGSNVAIMDNSINMNAQGQQAIRVNHMTSFIVSNNTVQGVVATKASIDVRSDDAVMTQYAVIQNNSVLVGTSAFGINPSGASTNLGSFDIIIETNYINSVAAGQTNTGIGINAERVSVRNNIIDATSVNMEIGVALRGDNGGLSLPSKDVWADNNTIYSGKVSGSLSGVTVDTTVSTGNYVRNNLVYTSGISGTAITDTGDEATKQTNTGQVGAVGTNPFVTTPTSTLTTYQPSTSAYAYNGGTAVQPPIDSDFFNCWDKSASQNRIGAVVTRSLAVCAGAP